MRTVEILKVLTAPPPLEQIVAEAPADTSAKPTDATPAPPRPAPGRVATPGPATPGPPGRISESRARNLSRELASLDGAMLQVIGGQNNSATARIYDAGDVPLGMLAEGAAGGVRASDVAGLNLHGDGGGVVRPGAGTQSGLPGAGDRRADARAGDVGKSAEVKKPVGRATTEPPTVTGGAVPGAGGTVAGIRGALRACYKRALDEDPNARGTVRITASIAPNGEVRSTQASGGGLSSTMIACVSRVVRGAQFNPPEGGGATVVIPMTFMPQ